MHTIRIMCLIASFACTAQASVLSKVYHHTCTPSDTQKNIQLGGVTCVFSDEIVINQMPAHAAKKNKLNIFIPDGTMQPSVKNNCDMQSLEDGAYAVHIAHANSPKKGIQIAIEYDPMRVVFARDVLPRVTRERKLVLYFYDKQLLDNLQKKSEVPRIMHAALNPTILIDAGHGGRDSGVIGSTDAIEKKVCLAVSEKVSELLKKNGIQAVLTRSGDQYISLQDRVRTINALAPHALVSIHANGGSPQANGIETYYFDTSIGKAKTGVDSVDTYIDSYRSALGEKNKHLAHSLQTFLCKELSSNDIVITDRSIKAEPLELLMQSSVPAALIEIGFLTNAHEAHKLMQEEYQLLIAQGICNGIMHYL